MPGQDLPPIRKGPFVVACLGCAVPTACATAFAGMQWLNDHECTRNSSGSLDVDWVDPMGAAALGAAVGQLKAGLPEGREF